MESNSNIENSLDTTWRSLVRWFALIFLVVIWIACYFAIVSGPNFLGDEYLANDVFENTFFIVLSFLFPVVTWQLITLLRQKLDWRTAVLTVFATLLVGVALTLNRDNFATVEISLSIAFMGLLGCMLSGKIMEVISTRCFSVAATSHPSAKLSQQLNIRKLLIWTTLIGASFAAIGTQALWLDMHYSISSQSSIVKLLIAGLKFGLIYLIGFAIVIAPVTYWLSHSKPFWLVLLSVILLPLAISIFGVIAYSESLPKDTWEDEDIYGCFMLLVLVISATFAISTICFIALSRKRCDKISVERVTQGTWWSRVVRVHKWCVFGCTIGFVLYLVGWIILHFGLAWLPSRDVDLLRNSSIARKNLEASFPPDVVERANQVEDSDDLIVFLNALLSDGVTKENNAAYQIANTSKIEYFDREDDFSQRQRLGFTPEEVDLLEDHQLVPWLRNRRGSTSEHLADWGMNPRTSDLSELIHNFRSNYSNDSYFYLMWAVPWTADELPLASEYCKSKQEVFEQIRKATKCEHCLIPVLESGYWEFSSLPLCFARESLMIDARFQIGRKNLEMAVSDLEALHRLGDLQPSYDCYARVDARRCYSSAFNIGFLVLSHPDCTIADSTRVLALLRDPPQLFKDFESQLPIGQALLVRQTSDWYFEELDEYQFSLTEQLPRKFPRIVDWQQAEFLAAERFESKRRTSYSTNNFTSNYSDGSKRFAEADDGRFSDSFARLLLVPKAKAQSPFWELEFVISDESEHILAFSIVTREGLDRIALALAMYKFEKGEYPKSLELLSPKLMQEVPLDPFTDKPFCYQRSGDSFLLYSAGQDQVDDGGTDSRVDWIWEKPCENVQEYLLKN